MKLKVLSGFVLVVVLVLAVWATAAAASPMTLAPSRYAELGILTPAQADSLGDVSLASATLAPSRYAELGLLTPAQDASLGDIVTAIGPGGP